MQVEDTIFIKLLPVQKHAAWLEEPQEMTTFDAGKDEPLLKDVRDTDKLDRQDMPGKGVEQSKQALEKGMPAAKTLDSVQETQLKDTDKLNQV